MFIDGRLGSRVHGRFAIIARQQVDIVTFLETDRPVESGMKARVRVGSTDRERKREKKRTCNSAFVAFGALSRSLSS